MKAGQVLVTGATGFVGRALVGALAARGIPARAVTRRPGREGLGAGVEVVQVGEIGPATDWDCALGGVEAVVHLAAHVHVAPERAEREAATFNSVNHLGSARLFEAAARHGVSTFVHVSSVTVLGESTSPGQPFHDGSRPDPSGPYARSKLAAEQALAALAAGGGPRLVVLRAPLVCGPGVGGNLRSLARLAAWPVPLPFGGHRNRRTLLSLGNLVAVIARVLDGPGPAGTYLLGDRDPVSTAEIVRHLREGCGRTHLLVPAPASLLRAAASLAGCPGLYRRLFGDLEVDASGFREAFGWEDVTDTGTSLREAARGLG